MTTEEIIKFTADDFDFLPSSFNQKKLLPGLYNSHYQRMLSYWISLFMRGKKSNTNKQVNLIIKFLFARGSGGNPYNKKFEFISNSEIKKNFGFNKRCGRPLKNPDRPFNNRVTLESRLKELVEDGLLEKTESVVPSKRLGDEKKKPTPYYRINANKLFNNYAIVQLTKEELFGQIDPGLSKEKLISQYKTLINDYTGLASAFKRFQISVSENKVDTDIVIKTMKKYGINEPEDQILKEIKRLQTVKDYVIRKQPVNFYIEDEWGNIEVLPSPDVKK